MDEKITVEAPSRKRMTAAESASFMASWWRVLAWDGSTIAYVPDKSTADFVASVLNRKMGRPIR